MNTYSLLYNTRPVLSRSSTVSPEASKILSFLSLQDGWHYGEGSAPAITTVIQALRAVHQFRDLMADAIEAFPDAGGGILVSAYSDETCIDALILPSGGIDYVVTKKDKEVGEEKAVTLQQLVEHIRGQKWLPGNSYDWSTQSTTAKSKASSNRRRSKTRNVPGFQWSMNAV